MTAFLYQRSLITRPFWRGIQPGSSACRLRVAFSPSPLAAPARVCVNGSHRPRQKRLANLLLVDDDAHIREVMRFALEKAGHQVTEASDGAGAFALFQQHAFDLVVLDIVMPELDGLELCRRIRAQGALPIIFVSSRDEELD